MKAMLIALVLVASAAQLAGPLARFSYSGDLARRMNAVYAPGGQTAADAPRFVADDARGRELAAAPLLGAFHSLIRAFPGCGNRQLQFAYAYGEGPRGYLVAFSQPEKRAPECPATASVAVATGSNAVTVRSFPDV